MRIEIDNRRSDWLRIVATGATEAEAKEIAADAVASVVETLGVPRHRIVVDTNLTGDAPVIELWGHPFAANVMGKAADRLVAKLERRGNTANLQEDNPNLPNIDQANIKNKGLNRRLKFNADSIRGRGRPETNEN